MVQKLYHASSATSSRTGFSSPDGNLTVAWLTSGYCVDEWLPQIITFLTSDTWTFNLSEIWPNALLWSNLVKQEIFFSGMEGANSFKINALVFAGLATTKTCKSKETKSQLSDHSKKLEEHYFSVKLFIYMEFNQQKLPYSWRQRAFQGQKPEPCKLRHF